MTGGFAGDGDGDSDCAGRRLTAVGAVGVVLGQGEGSRTSAILAAAGEAAKRLVDSVAPANRMGPGQVREPPAPQPALATRSDASVLAP